MSAPDLWTYRAYIIRVVDADTFWADVDLGFETSRRITLRLSDVDAFETRLTAGVTPEEKRMGQDLRDELAGMLEGRRVVVQTVKDKREKYGRYLATVWFADRNINEWVRGRMAQMIEESRT